MSSATDTAVVR